MGCVHKSTYQSVAERDFSRVLAKSHGVWGGGGGGKKCGNVVKNLKKYSGFQKVGQNFKKKSC